LAPLAEDSDFFHNLYFFNIFCTKDPTGGARAAPKKHRAPKNNFQATVLLPEKIYLPKIPYLFPFLCVSSFFLLIFCKK